MTMETAPREQAQLPATEQLRRAKITADLIQAQAKLRSWHTNRDSDSVRVQRERGQDFIDAATVLEELVHGARIEGYRLELSLADVALSADETGLPTYTISRGALDFLEIDEQDPLRSGEALTLSWTQSANQVVQRTRNVYFGEINRMVELGQLAETLQAGAEIEVHFEG